jgi:hypothetical protein
MILVMLPVDTVHSTKSRKPVSALGASDKATEPLVLGTIFIPKYLLKEKRR